MIEDFELTLSEAIQIALANNPEINGGAIATRFDQVVKMHIVKFILRYLHQLVIHVTLRFLSHLCLENFGDPAGTLIPVEFGTDNNWQGGLVLINLI